MTDTDDVPASENTAFGSADLEPSDLEIDSAAVDALIATWRTELGEGGSVSATDVQDRLLDLWGSLPEGPARSQVERWLTETLARHLYAVDDVQRRLATVLSAD